MTPSAPTIPPPLWHRVEDGFLVTCMVALLLVSFSQIALRNVFSVTLFWADPFMSHLVLFIGFLGALNATRQNKHVKMDAIQRFLPPTFKCLTLTLSHLFSTAICAVLAWHAYRFVADEYTFSTVAFSDIAAWKLQIVFPVVFAAMTLRYGRYTLDSAITLARLYTQPNQLLDE
jgi:TRAP-type C4-dicarboxylate transport system permease small subunit